MKDLPTLLRRRIGINQLSLRLMSGLLFQLANRTSATIVGGATNRGPRWRSIRSVATASYKALAWSAPSTPALTQVLAVHLNEIGCGPMVAERHFVFFLV